MKISPEQIEALKLQQQQENKAKKVDGAAFGEFLNQEVQQGAAQSTPSAPPVPGLQAMNPLLQMQQAAQIQQTSQVSEDEFVGKVEQLFGELESYAQQLGTADASGLKQAYSTLENIQGGVESLKKDWPGVQSENPELGSIVSELETVAVTEQIKFNRGDYV